MYACTHIYCHEEDKLLKLIDKLAFCYCFCLKFNLYIYIFSIYKYMNIYLHYIPIEIHKCIYVENFGTAIPWIM